MSGQSEELQKKNYERVMEMMSELFPNGSISEQMQNNLTNNKNKMTSQDQPTEIKAPLKTGKAYIGTKVVLAEPMHHNEFLVSQGKSVEPNTETLGDGYKVTYDDGYVSWSPKGVFERCYRELTFNEKALI